MKRIAALFLLCAATAAGAQARTRAVTLPEPWGEFSPAVRTHLFTDSSRADTVSEAAGDFRPILVRIWYPSDADSGTVRPYMPADVADAWRATMPAADGFEDAVAAHSLADAPLSEAKRRWPVLLFSHGRSFPVENYQMVLEQLASQGWVVAAISHPYEEALTRLPDGRRLPFRGQAGSSESERARVLAGVVEELVRDASHVIDRLTALDGDAADAFGGRLDLAGGVGYFGHSLGGAAAAWTPQRDRRVRAAASWEGQVYRDEDRPLRTRAPLLYVVAGTNRAELVGTQYRPGRAGATVYELVLEGASHASFGDMLHIYRRYAGRDWLERHRREMDPLRANQITGDYLHEFFAHYLLGAEMELLWPDSMKELESYRTWSYPEVELRVYGW
jgi:dienelactone hydrolase